MNLFQVSLVIFAIKLPVVWCCWYIYKTIHDVPVPEVERGGGDLTRADFEPGPRVRGPHGGEPMVSGRSRRRDTGHDETTPAPRVSIDS